LAGSGRYAAVICLSARHQGDTDHYDHVAGGRQWWLRQRAGYGVPVLFGVLTCDTVEQAINRRSEGRQQEASKAAVTAIEMVNLLRQLPDA
jgi:6,7-dimethyl-8-ribityllumazine synthase